MKRGKDNIAGKLRIAHFGQKNCMTSEGGIEVVVAQLAVRQAALGHDVTCYNRSGHHVSGAEYDVPKVKEWKGIHMKYVPTIQKRGMAAFSSAFFAAVSCAVRKYDVVHVHAEGPACFLPILTAAKFFHKNLKICFTCHGLDWKRSKWADGIGSKVIKYGEKMAVRFADEIIVLNKSTQEYFKNTYNRKTTLIPNGVNSPKIMNANLIFQEWGLKKDSYILYLSRITPEKGVYHLIKAYKTLNTDLRLVIAGGGSDTRKYEEEIHELAVGDDRIIFTGFVRGQRLAELYSNAYIYVLPSTLEGMPLSLLEAMSYGNCCLVSDIPECADVVGQNAMLFRTGDVDDLADKLQFLCENEALVEQYRDRVGKYIERKYNWEEIVTKTVSLYYKGLDS